MFSKEIHQTAVILLGGIEVGVDQRASFVVTPCINGLGVACAPGFDATLLFSARRARATVFWNNRRLKMIRQRKNQMHLACRSPPRKPLPRILRKPFAIRELTREALPQGRLNRVRDRSFRKVS